MDGVEPYRHRLICLFQRLAVAAAPVALRFVDAILIVIFVVFIGVCAVDDRSLSGGGCRRARRHGTADVFSILMIVFFVCFFFVDDNRNCGQTCPRSCLDQW